MESSKRSAVFLDRDGVINVHRPEYIHSIDDFEYASDARDAFEILGRLGWPVVVVTNQSGIARGYQTRAEVDEIHDKLRSDAREWGVDIASIEICDHLPTDDCSCRKPRPGMFERAAAAHGLQFEGSFMVGDAPADMAAGRNLGIETIRVATGRGSEGDGENDDHRVATFSDAVRLIEKLIAQRSEESK